MRGAPLAPWPVGWHPPDLSRSQRRSLGHRLIGADRLRLALWWLLGGVQEGGTVVVAAGLASRLLGLWREAGDLDGALGFGAVDAEFADGGVDTALLWLSVRGAAALVNRRRLRRLIGLLVRDPNPLRDMLRSLLGRQMLRVQVLSDLRRPGLFRRLDRIDAHLICDRRII
jgi:hypothetical protein